MCGIIGYAGSDSDAIDVLLDGLSGLEYRGYDSAGVALSNQTLHVHKREGELSALESALPKSEYENESVGIGHTRWSTHGPPSDVNAHPHTDDQNRVAVVHNGIIENYQSLRDELTAAGIEFESDTDTEVVPHLISTYLADGIDRETAFRRAIDRIEGSYAVAAVFEGTNTIYAARRNSPLVLGIGNDGYYLASDVPAFIEYTDRVIYLDDGEFARLSPSEVVVTDADGTVVETSIETISWDPEDAGKSGYDHYMLKEINEQPDALRKCLRGRLDELEGTVDLESVPPIQASGAIQFVACGTSYHAAMYGARLLRDRGVSAQAFLASEYDEETIPVGGESVVVGVTQSGETADTMRALRAANRAGAKTIAVTNVVGSSAARECDHVLYIRAGPEIGVAATKTFASQQAALTMLACQLTENISRETIQALRDVPDLIQTVLDTSNARAVAETYEDADAYFFIGRGYQYPVALEGALKMKEITYKHAEGFAAGELKHGPLALVTENTPVFALVTGDDERANKTIGNVKEVEARDAPVVAVTDGRSEVERYADHVLEVPGAGGIASPIVANVQLQLVSYWVANRLGRSIDKPRNLAKSVTVE
ncbi:glutamine--fructose-6-phosphate transaminase (isomerizing) [Natrialbaceae archaeon AArc-T1-2]|uniref:glutamine--fructose-6-phosphate transaminase (isomerizing) n=1 Tax=Natrialbaceae archaeon AArc-T1-2 TaxID=3053904 RepID=UPI00255B2129|nr:glutamine--fructose-6-phosphate transaminase (isomerizing) [Natrialbaceae archaeon AArc-T1-2]WIV68853.1 glutamine--fructose-6-phosphate transaminase (isomerizing) [Natrialbaceae archaeon AArc-T1-2]